MARTTHQALVCAYPGCENEPRPGEAGAKPKYCGLPDPVSGKPHTALSAFRRREELARQGGGKGDRGVGVRSGIRADMAALTGSAAMRPMQAPRRRAARRWRLMRSWRRRSLR